MRRSTAEQNSEGYISFKPTVLLFNAPIQASEQLRCLKDEYRSNQVTDIRFDTRHDSSALQWHYNISAHRASGLAEDANGILHGGTGAQRAAEGRRRSIHALNLDRYSRYYLPEGKSLC